MPLLEVYLCNRLNRVIPTNLFEFSLKKIPNVFFFLLLVVATGGKMPTKQLETAHCTLRANT